MQPAIVPQQVVTPPAIARQKTLAIMIGLAAVVWFMVLSGWMRSTAGSVMVKRQNVLFNADSNLWIDRMIGNERSPEQLIHPLEIIFWRAPCRAMQHVMATFLPPEDAGIAGARLVVALVHGLGVGFLAFLALRLGIKPSQCVLLFIIYFLFTSNCTAALPEHFGISNGLLSIAFVVPVLLTSVGATTVFLLGMALLCGGTTITNVLYPLAALWQYSFRSLRARLTVFAVGIPIGLGVFLFLYLKSYTMHHFVGGYLTMRLIRDPFRAFIYAIYAIVAPAVGPTPRIMREPGWDMVSYEPAHAVVRLSYYLGLQAIGAITWIIMLFKCIWNSLHDDEIRPYVWLPLGWVAFSIIFHNCWGDELVLFSPHWSWALMALVILGARKLPLKIVTTAFVPIVVSQIYTLITIHSALLTITR